MKPKLLRLLALGWCAHLAEAFQTRQSMATAGDQESTTSIPWEHQLKRVIRMHSDLTSIPPGVHHQLSNSTRSSSSTSVAAAKKTTTPTPSTTTGKAIPTTLTSTSTPTTTTAVKQTTLTTTDEVVHNVDRQTTTPTPSTTTGKAISTKLTSTSTPTTTTAGKQNTTDEMDSMDDLLHGLAIDIVDHFYSGGGSVKNKSSPTTSAQQTTTTGKATTTTVPTTRVTTTSTLTSTTTSTSTWVSETQDHANTVFAAQMVNETAAFLKASRPLILGAGVVSLNRGHPKDIVQFVAMDAAADLAIRKLKPIIHALERLSAYETENITHGVAHL